MRLPPQRTEAAKTQTGRVHKGRANARQAGTQVSPERFRPWPELSFPEALPVCGRRLELAHALPMP